MRMQALAKRHEDGHALQKRTRKRTKRLDSISHEVLWGAMRRGIAFDRFTVRYWHGVNCRPFPATWLAARTETFCDQNASSRRAARDFASR